MKKAFARTLISLLFVSRLLAADSPWQPARIVEVKSQTQTKNTVWVVNTPVSEDQVVYTITVHVRDRLVTGSFVPGETHAAPPETWVRDSPVQVQVAGDYLYVRSSPSDEVRARISRNKAAPPMRAWSPAEASAIKDAMAGTPAEPAQSVIGFDVPAKTAPVASPPVQAAPPPPPPPPAEPTTGQVTVSSVPYLAEVYVDDESVGYTPAKLRLPPGKHSFRCEKAGYKPWTKEITITAGSELTLDATLAADKK